MEQGLVDNVVGVLGVSDDRARFLLCVLSCYPLALIFANIYHIHYVSSWLRHMFQMCIGLLFCYFCFKLQVLLLLLDVGVCYLLIRLCSPRYVHIAVMVWALSFMSVSHIYRMYTDYNGYTLDFTGPTMIITMKVTSLACSIYDGMHRKPEQLNADQKILAIKEVPSLLEYMSYIFCFTSILTGPTFNMVDYKNFIEGTDMMLAVQNESSKGKAPSGIYPAIIKFFTAVFFISITFALPLTFEPFFDEEWRNSHSFLYIAGYMYVVCTVLRCNYYFAWILADSTSNVSGFGFNGYEEDGTAKWNKLTNVYPFKTECSSSLKLLVDNWNVGTAMWLRRVCYERSPISPTYTTYLLSAAWHGFYPGYYGCFMSLAFFITTSRKLRRTVRPHFLSPPALKTAYDILTTVCSVLLINFAAIQLCLLSFGRTLELYKYFYCLPHIVCILLFLFCPKPLPTKRE